MRRLIPPAAHDDPAALLRELADNRPLQVDAAEVLYRRHLDTFDGRLRTAGLGLVRLADSWRLEELPSGRVLAEEPARASQARWPRFAGDFPADGPLRDRLAKPLGVRALIHLVAVESESRDWRLLNDDGKIVLRGRVVTARPRRTARQAAPGAQASAPPSLAWLELHPLRGYEEHAEAFCARADALGCTPLPEPPLDRLMRAAGLDPDGYTAPFRVPLDPAMTAREAFAAVSHALLRIMRRNEAGLAADLDTEFLHDFRVAMRRQRSALAVFEGVLPAETAAAFDREFSALGKLTGPLRDLDVQLLDEARYRALLPASLQPGLDRLFRRLRTARAAELQRLRAAIASPEYRDLVRRWPACLDGPEAGPRAAMPAVELARRRLLRRRRRLLRRGRAIDRAAPDGDLHRLRIEGKKLRYLLEFFATLLPAGEAEALVKQLKTLQDNLGAFNDLSVQGERLQADLAALTRRGWSRAALDESAALGGLIAALAAERRRVRRRFERTFAAFDSPEAAARYERVLEHLAGPPAETEDG